MSNPVTGTVPDDGNSGEFGANEWLVDEMYERYLVDKNSVDQSWWPILEGYHPVTDPTPIRSRASDAVPPSPIAVDAGPQAPGRRSRPTPDPTRRPARPRSPAPPPRPRSRSRSPPRRRRPRSTPVVEGPEPAEPRTQSPPLKGMSKTLATNMDASLTRADRDERAHRAGEADDRQPHRHQQPPEARPRRQGLVHPPDRVGDGAGAQGLPEPERLLRRARRQAERRRARPHQPRHRDRPAEARRHPLAARARASSAPTR